MLAPDKLVYSCVERPTEQGIVKEIIDGCDKQLQPLCSECKKDKPQIHFHGSYGDHCALQLQYWSMYGNSITREGFKSVFLRDGFLHEQGIIEALKSNGNEVIQCNEELQKEYTVDAPGLQEKVLVVTHPDGIMVEKDAVLECKAVKNYAFGKYKKDITEIPKWYIAQCQFYMDFFDKPIAYLIVKARESGELQQFNVTRSNFLLNKYVKQFATIQKAIKEKRVLDKPYTDSNNNECRFCKFKQQCWG